MGNAFLYGNGGGTELAIKIIGGMQRPETGKQGTIWINTDQKITGWTIQGEEPISPTEGMVWINNITYASLNALKKNGIWFTPISAKQYTSGAWVKKTGEYYNNNQWVAFFSATIHVTYPAGSTCTATDGTTTLTAPDTSGTWDCVVPNAGTWTLTNDKNGLTKTVEITTYDEEITIDLSKLYLFNGSESIGIADTHITGGLETISTIWAWNGDDQKAALPSVSIASNKSYFDISIGTKRGGYHAVNMIDLTGFSKMYITGTVQSWAQYSSCAEQVRPSKTSVFAAQAGFKNTSGLQTVCLDISELSGLYDVAICIRNGGGSGTTALTIYDWWIE